MNLRISLVGDAAAAMRSHDARRHLLVSRRRRLLCVRVVLGGDGLDARQMIILEMALIATMRIRPSRGDAAHYFVVAA